MKHQNIYRALLPIAALASVFSACTFEQEDFFDESASLRIQHTNEKVKDILCQGSEQNGWLIQYYVAGTEDYDFEGFNLFGRFYNNGKVTLSGDHRFLRNGKAGSYTECTSFYEMLAEEGPVLCFDTWNDVLTVFVDPVSPSSAPGVLVNDGEGMHGDDRLVLSSYNENELVFRGERYTAPIRFIRLDRSPEEYIASTNSAKMTFAGGKVDEYSLSNGSVTRFVSGLSKGYFDYVDRLDDPLDKSVKSCVFTPEGFRTRDPFVLGNDTIQEFTLDLENERLVCGNVVMLPCWGRYVKKQVNANGAVTITAEGACDSFATLYNKLASDISEQFSTQTFSRLSFGRSGETGSNQRTGLTFYSATANRTYITGFGGSISFDEATNVLTIDVDPNDPSSNFNGYNNKGIGSSFTDIVNALNGSYSVTVNNTFGPKTATCVKTNDSSFYFQINF